ncbi:predicted protein [Thalassiosira pseudonana CCMP1335]|uniref:Uncharacterized protein n=1 Tax=Thalassiosira pseudonana TaxID=35128 RepID=B8BWJ0_THAPS|nr:predicted protein [Thalassiosira pseudonana CCMP1335]EED94527.1 predicted protein [Thalassiosira pseudonana CCMP1335]
MSITWAKHIVLLICICTTSSVVAAAASSVSCYVTISLLLHPQISVAMISPTSRRVVATQLAMSPSPPQDNQRMKQQQRRDKLRYSLSLKEDGELEEGISESGQSSSQTQTNVDDEEEESDFSIDSVRARAGVLRTRIRLKQEELTSLERLMKDVAVELRIEQRKRNNQRQSSDVEVVQNTVEGKNVMTENELELLNSQWKDQSRFVGNQLEEEDVETDEISMNELQLDLMKTRSAELQSNILLDRIKLQRLERRIQCCESSELGLFERAVGNTLDSLNEMDTNPITVLQRQARKFTNTFSESSSVLLRKIDRVSTRTGPNNRSYASVTDFVVKETSAGIRIVGSLLSHPDQLSQLIDKETPTLIPHVPAILSRLDRLESHIAPILSRVLNNKQHLPTIEPYLPEILERFDDIEPHLPWILENIDVLAPYTGLLLKHIDELLLYAEVDEYEAGDGNKDNYAFAEQLLPYLEVIKILSPHVGVLFSKGYKDLSASANMDILLFYFGWALRIPFVPRLFFSFPGSPGMVSVLANKLPKRLVRGRCSDVTCYVDGDYGGGWNKLSKEYEAGK